jgi:hypothetical protein
MRVVLGQYLDGASIDAVVKGTGYGQGTVSAYLNEIQKGAGVQLIRTPPSQPREGRLGGGELGKLRFPLRLGTLLMAPSRSIERRRLCQKLHHAMTTL